MATPATNPRGKLAAFTHVLWIAWAVGGSAHGASGFTEPPIIFYGKVTNNRDGYALAISTGTLAWTITPANGGTPLVIQTPLSALPGGFSYRLEIPVEKVPNGFTLTTGLLSTTAADYNRSQVTLDGEPVAIVSPPSPGGAVFSFTENQRGKIERADLGFSAAFLDSDGDSLPDWWEDLYSYDKFDPSDRSLDDNNNGKDSLAEYLAGTDPKGLSLDYPAWAALKQLTGAKYPFNADPDGDQVVNGIEFALDSNPNVPDLPLIQSRSAVSTELVGEEKFLVMSVIKPVTPRSGIQYLVESSPSLLQWSSLENTDVVTLQSTAEVLKVRLKRSQQTAGVPREFLRLKISETP